MADVFFSYAREDLAAVEKLDAAFRARGWTTWFDRHILAGERFRPAIQKEIQAAKAVVVLWSVHSVDAEWVHNEAELAKELGLLVPVLIDGSKLPFGFRERNAISLAGWAATGKAPGYDDLVSAIALRIEARKPGAASAGGERRKSRPRAPVLEKSPSGLLSWKPVGGALWYVVERDVDRSFQSAEVVQREERLWCATIRPGALDAPLSGPMVRFYYRVKAIGEHSESEWSNDVEV